MGPVLALAETMGASGAEIVTAYVAGSEALCRLGVGSRVVVFDGRGSEITAEIMSVDKGIVHLKDLISAKVEPLRCAITLAQAIPKGKNMDLIVQKATVTSGTLFCIGATC